MPFPAALTGQCLCWSQCKAVPISSRHCLPSSPRARSLSRVVPAVERLLWQSAIEPRLSLCAAHWVCALGLLWGHCWQAGVGHPNGLILGWVLSQLHHSGGSISTDGLRALEPEVPTRHLHALSFNTWEPVTHHPPLTASLRCLGELPSALAVPCVARGTCAAPELSPVVVY